MPSSKLQRPSKPESGPSPPAAVGRLGKPHVTGDLGNALVQAAGDVFKAALDAIHPVDALGAGIAVVNGKQGAAAGIHEREAKEMPALDGLDTGAQPVLDLVIEGFGFVFAAGEAVALVRQAGRIF